ncbi:histidinol dehydrogenase [Mesorhizobium sp. BH1-1-5]|uniref:histidinol dehydrogenase n=1 Tax=unclassified Mesorhizobium TaxID=325217 RepID=UPI00112E058E|nr:MULTISPECIES: histidinol dehydrogenase [unclassified Mesorhizobium]MBZ9988907.1 histidinol dehydrogenase [Mesorhizobium sp. BH1-1-5]TPJ71237.1 hypothetical protein FJ471_08190 [Mesorhizobium sp. B2-7-1]
MIRILKSGRSAEAKATDASAVRGAVESVLIDVEARGDTALRELSQKFDRWSPPSFRLSQDEIDACVGALSSRQLDDIRFAQAQIRRFAEVQKAALKDVEVETLPGVVLGHRNIPMNSGSRRTASGSTALPPPSSRPR